MLKEGRNVLTKEKIKNGRKEKKVIVIECHLRPNHTFLLLHHQDPHVGPQTLLGFSRLGTVPHALPSALSPTAFCLLTGRAPWPFCATPGYAGCPSQAPSLAPCPC